MEVNRSVRAYRDGSTSRTRHVRYRLTRWRNQPHCSACRHVQFQGHHFPVPPARIQSGAASRTQSLDRSFRPLPRKRREKLDFGRHRGPARLRESFEHSLLGDRDLRPVQPFGGQQQLSDLRRRQSNLTHGN